MTNNRTLYSHAAHRLLQLQMKTKEVAGVVTPPRGLIDALLCRDAAICHGPLQRQQRPLIKAEPGVSGTVQRPNTHRTRPAGSEGFPPAVWKNNWNYRSIVLRYTTVVSQRFSFLLRERPLEGGNLLY